MEQMIEPQGFIPGLPDDLVLNSIVTRIPWSSMYPLTWVNQRWRRAIRSREVYHTRKRNGMSQSMLVAPMQAEKFVPTEKSMLECPRFASLLASTEIGLGEFRDWAYRQKGSHDVENGDFARTEPRTGRYMQTGFHDVENGDLYMFPSTGDTHMSAFRPPGFETTASLESRLHFDDLNKIPVLQGRMYVPGCRAYRAEGMVALDGKLYAMQANQPQKGGFLGPVIKVLDIGACDWEWRICSKPDPCRDERNKDCPISWAVCNGKIHCIHTCNTRLHVELFDPENDTWREIEERPVNLFHGPPGIGMGHRPRLVVLNEEIHMAYEWEKEIMTFNCSTEKWHISTTISIPGDIERADLSFNGSWSMIVADGKLYNFVGDFVLVYNPESSSWTELQRTFHKDFVEEAKQVQEMSVVAFYDNEVVAMLETSDYYATFPDGTKRKYCKSVGFGVEGEALVWEQFPRSCFKNCLYTETMARYYKYAEGFWNLKPDIVLDYLEL